MDHKVIAFAVVVCLLVGCTAKQLSSPGQLFPAGKTTKACNTNLDCSSIEECNAGVCALASGKCNSDSDCTSWNHCNTANNACELNAGKCNTAGDCSQQCFSRGNPMEAAWTCPFRPYDCVSNTCVYCGKANEPCCKAAAPYVVRGCYNMDPWAINMTCVNDVCVDCGKQEGQPCCVREVSGKLYGACYPPFTCDLQSGNCRPA